MSKENEGMPFVPEEDLNLHENFAPIIAEDGLIRHPEDQREDFPAPDDGVTRMDIVQDLVAIRSSKSQPEATPQEVPPNRPIQNITEDLPVIPSLSPLEPVQETADELTPNLEVQPKPEPSAEEVVPSKQEETSPQEKPLPREDVAQNAPIPAVRKKKSKKERRQVKLSKKIKALMKKQPLQLPWSSKKSTPGPKKPRRWPWVVAVLCFLFLGGITGVVPVEKIPLLRNLAYAMGFTKADTARMSFLRALLTWTDKTVGFSVQPDGSRTSLWARLFGTDTLTEEGEDLAGLQVRLQRESGKTSLMDIHALNELQRQKGRQLDEIRGSVLINPGSEQGPNPAAMRDTDVSVHTEANQDKSDVFFGSDATATSRNFQDGYDSVNTLKKISNPYITNGQPIDWLTNTAQHMIKADAGLGGVNKELSGISLNWGTNINNNTGGKKPWRDLYFAWITSRMAKYTSNLMVKKALVDTGFMGADFPATASTVVGATGMQIDLGSLQQDQEAWQEYIEWEKKCNDEIQNGGGKAISEAVNTFNSMFTIKGGKGKIANLSFPQKCEAVQANGCGKYTSNLNTIQSVCVSAQKGYERLRTSCSMVEPPSNCSSEPIKVLANRCESFKNRCDFCAQARANAAANETAVPQGCEEKNETWTDDNGYDQTQTEDAVLALVGGATDYFPQTVRGKDTGQTDAQGLRIIEDAEGTGRVQQSLIDGFGHKTTLSNPF